MAGYVTVNRLSRTQLSMEDRKQQAHLKKIDEMQRRSGLDTSKPRAYPHLTQHYTAQSKQKNKQLAEENDVKLRKLLSIMKTKTVHPPPPTHHTSPNRHRQETSRLAQNNADYRVRIANTKSIYNVQEWNKDFAEHQEYLRISKDNKVFTPCDIAINQQRAHGNTSGNSKRVTPASSTLNVHQQSHRNN